MIRIMCKSKIHGAYVTEANLHYVGSLTIDRTLMEAANIMPYEWVLVVNVNTGDRFETYAIEGEAGSGAIGLNGAAARLGQPGDKVIIMCSGMVPEEELADFSPRFVFVDEKNRIVHPSHETEAEMNAAMKG
ncbi:MAG: aspartate 1-decarboxylase [Chloroflexia bacterium]